MIDDGTPHIEQARKMIQLDGNAFDLAITAAQEENIAGSDEQMQLEIAIKVYLYYQGRTRRGITNR